MAAQEVAKSLRSASCWRPSRLEDMVESLEDGVVLGSQHDAFETATLPSLF